MTEPLDAELLKDLRGLGKTAFVRRNRCRISRLSLQLPNSHEPRQHSLSTVDGQVRNPAESDLPASSEIAGRCTPEVLHTDVLFVGFDNERQCPNSWSDLLRNPAEQRQWRLIHNRYTSDTQNRQYALMQKIMMSLNQGFESLGSWMSENGNALLELRWQMQSSTQ